MIGKWIDSLTDEQRDRIITHRDPTYHGTAWWSNRRHVPCLVGCAFEPELQRDPDSALALLRWSTAQNWTRAAGRFDRLAQRFGARRVWRVVKARAAKRNRVNMEVECSLLSAVASDTKIV